jgi:hypothetical protein
MTLMMDEDMRTRAYSFYISDYDPIDIVSDVDAKAKFWEAKKCHYPTFEVMDVTGAQHVFVTDSILMLTAKDT